REDSFTILEMMKDLTGEEPSMWGENIIGFGSYDYTYASGREGTWFVTGFSPRKQSLTLYLMYGFEKFDDLLAKLGKHKIGKACLYINKLDDVDQKVLKQLLQNSITELGRYGA
ncbi:DUF1801 domain-containing protein, partial [Candidatus Zixiibacteriota bacterium]